MAVFLIVASCGETDQLEEGAELDPIVLPAEIIVIGDFGTGWESQYAVARAMRSEVADMDIDLFLTTGDNFYNDNIEEIWEQPYGWLDAIGIPLAAAWGNHDVESKTRRMLVSETLEVPGRWYAADLGGGKLIVLDSNQTASQAQLDWLVEELETASAPTVISFHHPAYSCGFYGNDQAVQEHWVPLFEDYEVTLVLNGHEHHYERFAVKKTNYVVTGGGGHNLRGADGCPAETPPPLASNYTDHHFVLLEIGEGNVSGVVIASTGEIIDTFAIEY